ncbi:MAG: type II toxin-antitoxin system HicA family toxin [Chloroflexi bacterium]|nr:type II toxin-antitoxin system HicA family toxin [Chloroflexota bacterium]
MTRLEKLLSRVLRGSADANIAFDDLCWLLSQLGFEERVRGGHHIYTRQGIEDILNLQPLGPLAKPYQVQQVRRVIVRHKLGGSDDSL